MNSTPAETRRSPGRRTSDALLRRALEIAHLGWWQVELSSLAELTRTKPSWSDEAYRILGYEPRTAEPSTDWFFSQIVPDDRAMVGEALDVTFAGGTEFHMEYRIERPDGSVRLVDNRATVERTADGVPVRMVGTIHDVTDRRRIEEALSGGDAGSRLLAQLVENSHDAILSATLDGVVTTWNPAAEHVFGWKASEIIGRRVSVLVPPTLQGELESNLELAARGMTRGPFETVRMRRDGTPVDIELSLSPIIDSSGTIIGASAIIRDITQQKRIAEQMQHAQRLESVGRLAGGVAHDFNNMLMAITGYAELVLMDMAEDSPAREDLRALLSSADRGARLTRQLLAFGRRQVLHPISLDLNAVVRDMENILHPLTSTDIALRLHLCSVPALVVADRAQLEQVVVNLVANACDAMPHGGAIDIDTSVVAFGADRDLVHPAVEPGRYVRLAVRDTGIGMDADVQSRLFEPFFSTKSRGTNTGMGLATTYGIIKQSGGFITVESAPNQGSTFRVFLPLRGAPSAGGDTDAGAAATAGGGETILVVEDDDGVRKATTAMLKRMGYSVLGVATPTAALELIGELGTEIDLLLTDIVLPEMSGTQLAAQVRGVRPAIRVVCMSGYPDAGDRAGLEPGVNYLPKPFTADSLARVLRGALAR